MKGNVDQWGRQNNISNLCFPEKFREKYNLVQDTICIIANIFLIKLKKVLALISAQKYFKMWKTHIQTTQMPHNILKVQPELDRHVYLWIYMYLCLSIIVLKYCILTEQRMTDWLHTVPLELSLLIILNAIPFFSFQVHQQSPWLKQTTKTVSQSQ